LWNALWDLHPDFDYPTLRFGGWADKQVFMEQWSGGSDVCGQFVDRNTIVNPRLIYSQEEEDNMTPQELLKQMLTLNVPIWPTTKQITLSQLLHYAYHGSPTEHEELATINQILQVVQIAVTNRDGLQAANDAFVEHLAVHNSSGGVIDRSTGEFVAKLAALLGQMGDEVDELAETFE
jgi:hypothetical protein